MQKKHIANFIEKSKKYLGLESSTTDATDAHGSPHGLHMATPKIDFTKDVCFGNETSATLRKDGFTL